MATRGNGSVKFLLWVGGGIVISVSVTVFLISQVKAACPLSFTQRAMEEKINLHYKVISEDIKEIKEDIKHINEKME